MISRENKNEWDIILDATNKIDAEEALFDKTEFDKFEKNTWICDSRATCHMRNNNDEGMYDTKNINEEIIVGSGKTVTATMIGNWRGVVMQKTGNKKNIILENVKVVPELWVNLLSINCVLSHGWLIGNKQKMMYLQKNNYRLWFDRFFLTKGGHIQESQFTPLKILQLRKKNRYVS